ncbi:hypothetical protein [Nostoc sp. FACHB-280]|uniref:hypothetical protein n=1 Tax=Nostoc sp. FACHB-280 TaxID=2692839 RepID=UPI00168B4588|nr:hypothetical protein [Nostoc sp. FACHB-280]MBD2497115.1 hypothetical protein [Nostoc sp. FACHB-280]
MNNKYVDYLKSKIALEKPLSDTEIEWLEDNGREDIIALAKQKHFTILKRKYGLIDPLIPMQPFYEIMLKLEKKERLDILLVTQLIEKNMLSRDGKIAIAHYRLEAEFYEQEIKQNGNKNKIPTASSYWRKANEPKQALKLTNIDLSKIRDTQIKSAILVTRGAAFRDINDLSEAENCARKAVAFQPDGYQPYTLMGAICYDRHDYEEGDIWFEQAIQLGAEAEDIDAELKRVFRNTKNEEQRHEAAMYLLKKDPHRYAWAKSYLKTTKNHE